GPRDRDAAFARLRFDAGDDLVQSRSLVVLDVHAHLRMPGARQRKTERADAWKPPPPLAHAGRDLARTVDIARREVDVERDQRAPRTDDPPACTLVQPRGA